MTDQDANTASQDTPEATREAVLNAALMHVAFDGWSEAAFRAAISDAGVDAGFARLLCPRGALDLAVAFHHRGDAEMERRLASTDLGALRMRERVATAVLQRLEAVDDKEAVRRAASLFALPQHSVEGAGLIWSTADRIWNALGDSSDDINWYTKRSILSGVYASSVLYWLGDNSPGHEATRGFVDRRIDEVMQFERLKAAANGNRLVQTLFAGPIWLASKVRAPGRRDDQGLPGMPAGGAPR